jgi:hypothetical protein
MTCGARQSGQLDIQRTIPTTLRGGTTQAVTNVGTASAASVDYSAAMSCGIPPRTSGFTARAARRGS